MSVPDPFDQLSETAATLNPNLLRLEQAPKGATTVASERSQHLTLDPATLPHPIPLNAGQLAMLDSRFLDDTKNLAGVERTRFTHSVNNLVLHSSTPRRRLRCER